MVLSSRAPAHTEPHQAKAPVELVAQRYAVLGRLGGGGAGVVLRVRDTFSGRELALKRLLEGKSQRVRSLFEFEYHTLAGVRSPHIVEAYEYGNDEGCPYYTMELLSGTDLSDGGPQPWRTACDIVRQAASALSLLHVRRLVHRDVSLRNLWRTEQGAIKLLDLGALAPFGQSSEVLGTPPFVAPEAFFGQPLDQRTDIYALGAVLYWLVTGTHAYPAKRLPELSTFWSTPLVSASKRLRGRSSADADGDALPRELDALIESMLNPDPRARPAHAADLIYRLRVLVGDGRRSSEEAVQARIEQPAFVGRGREVRHFRRQLRKTLGGEGQVVTLQARAGLGRTRTLAELGLDARLAGAAVLQVDAAASAAEHGTLNQLSLRLLDALPEVSATFAGPVSGTLGHLSPRLRQRLGDKELSAIPNVAGEARTRIHDAMTRWVVEASRVQPLVVLVDNVEKADESSSAWLLALGLGCSEHAILVVVACDPDAEGASAPALRMLAAHSTRVLLRPLAIEDVRDLFASLFGEVPHLDRLAERLHRATHGNPAHLLELAEHLVQKDAIVNDDGIWILPHDLPDAQLTMTRRDVMVSRLADLSDEARAVARLLSIRQAAVSHDGCVALTQRGPKALHDALAELVQQSILLSSDDGYRFREESTREALWLELSEDRRKQMGVRLGRHLLDRDRPTVEEQLEAYVLLLEANPSDEVSGEAARIALKVVLTAPDKLVVVAPLIERALASFRANGRAGHELLTLLAALAVAGYFGDRRYLERYSEEAVETLSCALHVPLMQRLRPWVGPKLSLAAGLLLAKRGFRAHRASPCVPGFKEALLMFFNVVGSMAGVATITIDPKRARRLQGLLEPFATLGARTPARSIFRYSGMLAASVEDRLGKAYEDWARLIAELRDPALCPGLPEQLRVRFLGGALYARGVLQCFRDDESVLRAADELEAYSIKYYRMSADQLRATYYANQGNSVLAERYRKRAELHAIQRGSAWQIEIWVPAASITVQLRTDDALGMKHASAQLRQQAKRSPSLRVLADRAEGAYLLLRGRYAAALPFLEACLKEEPLGVIGWGRAHGALARALNGLGEHARAKQICEGALGQMTPGDLVFSGINLGLQIECALAKAGLGDDGGAKTDLDALLALHAPRSSPLSMGALHEARARVALRERDHEVALQHQTQMDARFRATGISSLIARCEAFDREVRRQLSRQSDPLLSTTPLDSQASTCLSSVTDLPAEAGVTAYERDLHESVPGAERAARVLSHLLEAHPKGWGGLWLLRGGEATQTAQIGAPLPKPVSDWVAERMNSASFDEVTQTDRMEELGKRDPSTFAHAGWFYRVSLVPGTSGEWVGAVVLGAPLRAPRSPPFHVLQVVGAQLQEQVGG